jgi:hypothetical protein
MRKRAIATTTTAVILLVWFFFPRQSVVMKGHVYVRKDVNPFEEERAEKALVLDTKEKWVLYEKTECVDQAFTDPTKGLVKLVSTNSCKVVDFKKEYPIRYN